MKLGDLARRVDAKLVGDPDVDVVAVRAVDEAGPGEIAFASHPKDLRRAAKTRGSALLVPVAFAAERAHEMPCAVLGAANPALALQRAVDVLHPQLDRPARVDPRAAVDPAAKVEPRVAIGAFAVVGRAFVGQGAVVGPLAHVGDGCVIGADARIGPGAIVLDGVEIGPRCVVGPGAVVGGTGFVYAPDGGKNVRVRHVGGASLEADVDIGANASVDAGLLRTTRVGRGTKVDALVQIGHDVSVGEDAVVVAHGAIGGHARIGDRAVLAGRVAVKDHVSIGDDARIGGGSGVTRDVGDGGAATGYPAIPHARWLKAMALVARLDELEARVRALEGEKR